MRRGRSRGRGRGDFDIRDFLMQHYQYLIVGGLFIILVIVLAIFSAKHKSSKSKDKEDESTEATTEAVYDENSEIPLPDEDLQVDAYPEVNALVNSYFTAMATGDIDTLATICSDLDDAAKIRIQEKANYTESYDDIKCYTKPGPIPNSYIVFAYYQIKYVNIDTKAPGLSSLYVCTDDNTGSLYVYNGELSENVSNYIKGVAAQEDVVALLSAVDTEYNNAIEADKTLKAFMDALPARLDEAVASRLASGATDDGSGEAEENTEVTIELTDSIRIRSSPDDSDTSNVITTATKGDKYTKIGEEDNWTKIRYKDTEAYVSSDYVKEVDESSSEGGESEGGGETASASGSITVTDDSVRVRSSADTNTNDNVIGTANSGENYNLTGETSDGWYQIDYKGQTGYIKGDFASKN